MEYEIIRKEGDFQKTLGVLKDIDQSPIPLQMFGENIASVLNGNKPAYRFGNGYEMRFDPHAGGIDFSFREKDKPGVGVHRATFTSYEGVHSELIHLIDEAPDLFGLLMKSAWEEERRKEPRTTETQSHSKAPKPPIG